MKIIRTLWGNSQGLLNEIPPKPLFEDEIVFVWGNDNYLFLKEKGYNAYRVYNECTEPQYSHHLLHYAHKLKALKIADKLFGEYLFLDWDIKVVKPIDDDFYSEIRKGNSIQCPLYAYPTDWENKVCKHLQEDPEQELTPDLRDFINNQHRHLLRYSWKYEDISIIPCACFIYSNNTSIGTILLDIFEKNNIQCCIEEFALYHMANCSDTDYIQKYEPTVINGKEYDKKLQSMTDAVVKLNSRISKIVNKKIYLHHDTY